MTFYSQRGFALASLVAAVGLASLPAAAADFVAGKDYRVLDNPETISGDKIIVREFFWYGCPHCYALNPYMQKWSQTKADDVIFLESPAALNPTWEVNARGFYAAQLMGYQGQTHNKLFDAIHKDNKRLFDQKSLSKWYASQGLDQKKFDELYNSFAVSTKVARSKSGAKRYQLTGVPSVVVHGRYVVQASPEKVPEVVDYLVNQVRADLKAGK
ncbi:thiol:disulfide interchange protein DsbA/DsbL [Psychrobacter sp. FDAARGOS_221]|uniref:thiol:disulfide interchange protein DsbA/DsbL n=1 Tax=Psychrobacter sp. FDAARGOS_221 TaxID=1975705 RepID=UPI000BB580D8|nr:thiol:disulfide interchange protein DsbA/DsbL [Psychrobacter sp. FDAARGOS_221]PNK61044.1 thiol:disulfide interchange protein DsbA/DsbL [Psychrobacter sp. FDAARGOS_221]